METSTPQTPLEKVEEKIIAIKTELMVNPKKMDLNELVDCIYYETRGNFDLARPVIKLLFDNLGMGIATKVTELISQRKNCELEQLAIQRSTQFGTSSAMKG